MVLAMAIQVSIVSKGCWYFEGLHLDLDSRWLRHVKDSILNVTQERKHEAWVESRILAIDDSTGPQVSLSSSQPLGRVVCNSPLRQHRHASSGADEGRSLALGSGG